MQAQANAEEVNFQAKTENGDLKFFFGDHSTHAGNFVFHPGVTGTLKRAWSWPIKTVISILDLVGDKTFRISDDGAARSLWIRVWLCTTIFFQHKASDPR
jgi:hypothetical protein